MQEKEKKERTDLRTLKTRKESWIFSWFLAWTSRSIHITWKQWYAASSEQGHRFLQGRKGWRHESLQHKSSSAEESHFVQDAIPFWTASWPNDWLMQWYKGLRALAPIRGNSAGSSQLQSSLRDQLQTNFSFCPILPSSLPDRYWSWDHSPMNVLHTNHHSEPNLWHSPVSFCRGRGGGKNMNSDNDNKLLCIRYCSSYLT